MASFMICLTIDRGSFSVDVVLTLLAWKAAYPKHMFMSRGNHESKNLNKLYGFEGEVKNKHDVKIYDLFSELFCYLPIGHCINKKILVVHGGLFAKDEVKLEDNRVREPADEGIMCECLWSDPCDQDGRHPSKRGVGVQFGPDVAARFLDDNNLSKSMMVLSFLQRCLLEATKSSRKVSNIRKEAEF
jgi:serine/threonine-protein phosphatase 5